MKRLKPLAESGNINRDASIRDSQAIIINEHIDKVWEILTHIEDWPKWNEDIKSVDGAKLEVGSKFSWVLGGIHITSTVRKIESPELLTWTGTALGIKAIHVWKLEESDGQTIVSTEESVEGFRTLLYNHQKLHSTLLNWLARLKQRVENQ